MTYEEFCTFEVQYEAYLTARKGKRDKRGTTEYEALALQKTSELVKRLKEGTYHPSRFEVFVIFEPKKRLIQAPAFVDKVVLHAVVDNILYKAICQSFVGGPVQAENVHGGILPRDR